MERHEALKSANEALKSAFETLKRREEFYFRASGIRFLIVYVSFFSTFQMYVKL